MAVRDHKSKHDRIAELPLITESARVTRVTTMDRDRRAEALAAVKRWLAEYGVADRYDAPADADGLAGLRRSLA
ncbi:MAG: oxidoreductase, partial [Halobacteriaceae archaeon]